MLHKNIFFISLLALSLGLLSCTSSSTTKKAAVAAAVGAYTKLDSSGGVLKLQNVAYDSTSQAGGTPAAGSYWDCIQVAKTGLTWEVKTGDNASADTNKQLRYYGMTYNWRDATDNVHSSPATADCSLATAKGNNWRACDTATYIAALNAKKLCGKNNWRLPTLTELASLTDSTSTPQVNPNFFPNTTFDGYWTVNTWSTNYISTTGTTPPGDASDVLFAAVVLTGQGGTAKMPKLGYMNVRAVANSNGR